MIVAPPSPQDILLYRYQHATNLGSVFVLERWLRSSMYDDDTPGSSEIEAIKRYPFISYSPIHRFIY